MDKKNIRILVSACLLGVNCRYDGKNGRRDEVLELLKEYELIPAGPEQMGGLGTPREPAECRRDGGQVRVMNRKGCDVTEYFEQGGEEALKIAKLYGCRYAILKERSPSCGSGVIYDGTFSGVKTAGDGVTARLLKKHGIKVAGESGISSLISEISSDMMDGSINITQLNRNQMTEE